MSVKAGVSVLSQPNHPARLLAIFGGTAAACAVVAAAALALMYVIGEEREAAPRAKPLADVEAPDGLVVVVPVADAQAFEELTGFAPVEAAWLPEGTQSSPVYSVTPEDDGGKREGRVSYGERDGFSSEGVRGPAIVLVEAMRAAAPDADGTLRRLTAGNGRTLVSRFACGEIAVEAQFYFSPPPEPGAEIVTPYMRETAQRFVDELRESCA